MHWLLKVSMAALLAGNAADTASSWGYQELNPVLGRGTFGARQTAIKFAIPAALIGAELILVRKHPEHEKAFERANFIAAGALGGLAIRNYEVTH